MEYDEVVRQLEMLIEGDHDVDDSIYMETDLYHRQWEAIVIVYNAYVAARDEQLFKSLSEKHGRPIFYEPGR